MTEIRQVARNMVSLILGGIVARFALYFIEIMLARKLGQESFGIFSTAFVFATTLLFAIDFGMNWKLVQEGSRASESIPVTLGTVLFTKSIFFLIAYPVLFWTFHALGYDHKSIYFFSIFVIYVLPIAFQETFAAAYQAKQKMEINAFYQGLTPLIVLILIFFFINRQSSLDTVALLFIAGATSLTIVWGAQCRNYFRPKINIKLIPDILKGSYLFGLSSFLTLIFFRVDTIMLSVFRNMSEVGIYVAGYKVLEIVYKIPVLFNTVLMPVLFKYSKENQGKYYQIYKFVFRFSTMLGLISSALIFIFSDFIISSLFGENYINSALILKILSACFAFKFITISVGNILTTSDRQYLRTRSQGISTVANVILNFFLIPLYGGTGAAIATLLSEIVLFTLYLGTAQQKLYALKLGKLFVVPFLIMLGIMISLFLISRNPFLISFLMLIIFFTILFVINYFRADEIRLVRDLIYRKR